MAPPSSRLVARLPGFVSLPILGFATSLLALPFVARQSSPAEWASLAIGQSVGAAAALVISYGWSLTGPSQVARSNETQRKALFAESIAVRLTVLCAVAPPALLVAAIVAPAGETTLCAYAAAAMAAGGLSPSWYFIGLATPRSIAVFEIVPKLAGNIASVALISTHQAGVLVYPALLLISTLLGIFVHAASVLSGQRPQLAPAFLRRSIRTGFPAMLTEAVGGLYSSATTALVGIQATALDVAQYSSGERTYRIGLFSVSSLSAASQAWVAETGGDDRARRIRTAFRFQLVLAALGLIGLSLAGSAISSLLFGSALTVDRLTMFFFGIAFAAVCLSTAFGRYVLIPAGRTRTVLISTLSGALVGVPSILYGSAALGAPGGALGVAISQLLVAVIQGLAIRRSKSRCGGKSSEQLLQERKA